MLQVYQKDGKNKFSCRDDNHLFRHLMEIENAKLLEGHPHFGQSEWAFMHFSPKRVEALYEHTPKHLQTPRLRQAYELGFGLAEIYTGNLHNPVEIVLTPDVDLKSLEQQWCRDYCEAHGYQVVEKETCASQPHSSVLSEQLYS